MGFLRITRTGFVAVEKATQNQCRDVGHRYYRFQVSAVVPDTQLDGNGFVIDHSELNDISTKAIEQSGSCEQMCIRVGKAIVARVGAKAWVYVRIRAVTDQGDSPSWTEWNSDMDFEVSKLQPE